MSRTPIIILAFLALLQGCSATTKQSRELAASTKESIAGYEEDRRRAIDELNANYRQVYASQLGQYRRTLSDRLELERRSDARRMADSLLLRWNERTTFTAVTDELASVRDRQLAAIDARAESIRTATESYADSYAELSLELKKLATTRKRLDKLSQEPDALRDTLDFMVRLGEAWKEVNSDEQ